MAIQQGVLILHGDPHPALTPGVPGLLGVRIYGEKPDSNGNNRFPDPPEWPAGPSPTTQGPIVYSIYPIPDTILNPKNSAYFATIAAIGGIIDSAPPGSYLTAWHEALSLRSSTPPGANPTVMRSLHSALNQMCRQSSNSANVTYGSIFGGNANLFVDQGQVSSSMCPPEGTFPYAWDSVPDDLGFYGIDVYGGGAVIGSSTSGSTDDINRNMCFLDTFIANAEIFTANGPANGYPKILIAEANNNSSDANRVAWFKSLATRMREYGSNAVGILTFWGGAHAALSGAWDPIDFTVIQGMNDVINNILAYPRAYFEPTPATPRRSPTDRPGGLTGG